MLIDWSHLSARVTDVGRSRWPRGGRIDPSWSLDPKVEDFDLWFIWQGRASIRLRAGWRNLRPGVCIWMRPGWRYDVVQIPDDPLCLSFVHFGLVDDSGKPLPAHARLPPEYFEPADPQLAEVVTRRLVELAWGFALHGHGRLPTKGPAADRASQMLTALLMEIDSESNADAPGGNLSNRQRRAVQQATCRIVESPHDVPSVSELARQAGYSVEHFIRIFRNATGLPPQKFVVQARTRLTQRLLRETQMTVGEIADAAGYGDIYFFSRQFKQVVGVSPSEYRKDVARDSAAPSKPKLRRSDDRRD
jgi:AraC-like DNA-binding protein